MRLLIVLFLGITTATTAPATDTNAKKVDQLFAAFEKPGSPGCSVGIIRNSSFVYKKSFGYASLEFGVPLTPESVFYLPRCRSNSRLLASSWRRNRAISPWMMTSTSTCQSFRITVIPSRCARCCTRRAGSATFLT